MHRSHLEEAYRRRDAAGEYLHRHRKSVVRRFVSYRESRIVERLLSTSDSFGRDNPGEPTLVLDAPCGAGRVSKPLGSAGHRIVALDASVHMIRIGLAEGLLPLGRSINAGLFALPFPDKTFKGAVCVRFFHHLEKPEHRRAVLTEFRRVVSGPLVISAWTGPSFQWWRRVIKQKRGRRPSARYRIPLSTLKKDASDAGWRLTRVHYLFRFISETAYFVLE